jgi:hypothetical protein
MNIAIVGNSRPQRNYSSEIDSCDLVIRFSKLNFLESGMIGKKTNHIYINANENFLANIPLLKSNKIEGYGKCEIFMRVWDENQTKKICELLKIKKYTILREETVDMIDKKYDWPRVDQYFTTTGLMTIVKITEEFPNAKIKLFCFNYDSDFGEFEFEDEFEFIMFLEYHGKVKLIS